MMGMEASGDERTSHASPRQKGKMGMQTPSTYFRPVGLKWSSTPRGPPKSGGAGGIKLGDPRHSPATPLFSSLIFKNGSKFYNIKVVILSIFKYTTQWHWLHSQGRVSVTAVHFQHFFVTPNRNSAPIKHELPAPRLLATTILLSLPMILITLGLPDMWNPVKISYICPFVMGFFHSAYYFQGSLMLLRVSEVPSF